MAFSDIYSFAFLKNQIWVPYTASKFRLLFFISLYVNLPLNVFMDLCFKSQGPLLLVLYKISTPGLILGFSPNLMLLYGTRVNVSVTAYSVSFISFVPNHVFLFRPEVPVYFNNSIMRLERAIDHSALWSVTTCCTYNTAKQAINHILQYSAH